MIYSDKETSCVSAGFCSQFFADYFPKTVAVLFSGFSYLKSESQRVPLKTEHKPPDSVSLPNKS